MRADAGRGGRGGVRGGRRPKGRGEFATGRARAGRQTRPVELRRARSCGAPEFGLGQTRRLSWLTMGSRRCNAAQ